MPVEGTGSGNKEFGGVAGEVLELPLPQSGGGAAAYYPIVANSPSSGG